MNPKALQYIMGHANIAMTQLTPTPISTLPRQKWTGWTVDWTWRLNRSKAVFTTRLTTFQSKDVGCYEGIREVLP